MAFDIGLRKTAVGIVALAIGYIFADCKQWFTQGEGTFYICAPFSIPQYMLKTVIAPILLKNGAVLWKILMRQPLQKSCLHPWS